MTTQAQDEFLTNHAPDGNLTAEQAARLLELGDQGDTGTTLSDTGGAPDASTAAATDTAGATTGDEGKGEAPAATQAQTEAKPATADEVIDPSKTVIAAKDGVHTIAYEKLVAAREGERAWRTKAEDAQRELDALKAEAATRAAAGAAPTATDKQVAVAQEEIAKGADPALFGDFSEQALADGIQKLIEQRVAAATAQFDAKLDTAIKPVQAQAASDAHAAHYRAIYEKHPDADSIAESQEMADWIAKQPSFAQAGYRDVLANGTTAQIVEFFDTFKAATAASAPAAQPAVPSVDATKAAAKKALAAAPGAVPASLSDIPGGRPGASDPDAGLSSLNSVDQVERMASMSVDQINGYMDRLL